MMFNVRFATCFVAGAVSCCLLFAPRESRAELSDAVYSDAKDIIEELLTKEVSHQVAPGVACLSGQTVADAGDASAVTYTYEAGGQNVTKTVNLEAARHFPKTLQHVYNQQYGTLRGTIRAESAGLGGFLVYQALHAAVPQPQGKPGAAKEFDNVVVQTTKAGNDCPINPGPADAAKAATCGTANAAAATLSFKNIDEAELGACKTAVNAKFVDGTWGRASSYPLDVACGPPKAETFECDVAFAVRAALLSQSAAAQDHLIKATAVAARELVAKLYSGPQQAAVLDAVQQQVLFLLRQQLNGDRWDPKALEERLTVVARGAESIDLSKLEAAAQSVFFEKLAHFDAAQAVDAKLTEALDKAGVTGTDADKKAMLERLSKVQQVFQKLEQLHAAWRSAINVDTGKLDVAAFVHSLMSQGGALSVLCDGKSDTLACRVIGSISGSVDVPKQVRDVLTTVEPIIAFAGKGEYTEAAQLGVRYVFQLAGHNQDELAIYERFAESVVTYVLDTGDEKMPSQAARVAFRSAAVEMIEHLGQGGGLRRGVLGPWYTPLLPDLAMRVSYSPSYINTSDGTARVQASANWLNFRFRVRRTEAAYVGVELSLLDPLAPLSELALRKTEMVHYDRVANLAANIFTPRVEVLAGSPILSEHLAISAGLSLRMAAPTFDKTATQNNSDGDHYIYSMVWNAKDESGDSLFFRFLEFGLAAKYVL